MPTDNMVGYVEDVDEDIGSTIGVESTRRYARSAAARSPERERSNTGKPRMPESDSDDETASSSSSLSDSDSTPAPTRDRTRPVPVEHRRPLHHKERDHRRPPQDSRPPRDNRALARDDRQRRERRPREDDDDHRRPPRPQPKDRDPRDARDPRDLRDPRGPKKTRPGPPKHAASQPVVSQGAYRRGQFEDPAAYGVQQAQQLQQPAASGRPRAKSRPASYYAGQPPRPPLDMGWPGPHAPLPPPPGAFGMGNFPPPPHMFPGGPPMHPGMPPPQSPMGMGPPPFFDGPSPMGPPPPGEHLRHRFDGGGRPASAMGFGSPPEAIGYFNEKYDDYEEEQHQKVARRSSRAKKAPPPLEERKKLPPSEFALKRTQSARPTSAAYKPPPSAREPMREPMREMREPLREMREPLREAPREHTRDHQLRERPLSRQGHQRPPPSHRRSVGFVDQQAFDEDDFLGGEVDLYQEVSPNQRRTALARPRRSSSVAYDQHGYDIVPAGNRGRRSSMYGPLPGESGGVSLEEDGRYFDALRYQEDVSGGAPMPLTAETLRKASKRGELASSRSTRSSGSHDESDYKRSSHTTGLTTQSSAAHNNDDFTIKVSGQAVVKLPGAQIECDGGEITFSGNRGAGAGPGSGMHGASRAGSDKESTVYQLDDARSSRMDRKALPHRPRATSQSDVHSRIYAPTHAPYEHAPYEHVPYEHAPYEQAPYEHGPYDAFEPYEPVTYEHAPYDPSLAASNFY
ncbi:hypothetical protein V8C40DRAFT_50044 [Trichoderma camerunense]